VVVTLALAAACTRVMAIHRLLSGGTEAMELTHAIRFGSLGGDPNVHAGQVNCILPMLAAAIPFLRGRYRLALVPVLLLLIGSVIVSQSRAGMVILVLVLLGLLLRSGRHARALMAITAVVLVVVLLWLPRIYWVRFVSIGQLAGIVVDRSLLLRQHAMQTAWQVFVDHPLFGVGLGALRDHSPRHMLGTFVAHNSFLEVAATLGVVGLAAYAAWLWTGFGMARRAAARWAAAMRPRERALAQSVAFAILVYCATAMFLSIQFYPFFLLLLGLANAARRGAPVEPPGAAAPGS
jgi:O-antigen ligase